MISKEEVKHIANLARLKLTEDEIEKMQKDLTAILDYFEILKKAPKISKDNTAVPTMELRENAAREDIAEERNSRLVNDLLSQAPEKKDGYIKVKAVL